jgi:hypothetical protein
MHVAYTASYKVHMPLLRLTQPRNVPYYIQRADFTIFQVRYYSPFMFDLDLSTAGFLLNEPGYLSFAIYIWYPCIMHLG